MLKRLLFIFLFLVLTLGVVFAGETGKIRGKVVD